jgi:hypothetical protein
MNDFAELKAALWSYDEWPTPVKRLDVVNCARRFVKAVEARAEVIEYYRAHVTPTEQALSELLPHD